MHKYYLITPTVTSPSFDPGCTFIRWGLRHLIKAADPKAVFLPCSDVNFDSSVWKLLYDQGSCLILAGIPLYMSGNVHCFWDWDIWPLAKAAVAHNIPVVDLFGYSKLSFPSSSPEVMSASLLDESRTHRTLDIQSLFSLIITRDTTSSIIASSAKPGVKALPCSGFWAAQFAGVKPRSREFNAVAIRYKPGDPWFLDPLYRISLDLGAPSRCFMVCHTAAEYWWAKAILPKDANLICLFDPFSLLDFYSRCEHVVSLRLHASIPALSLGCKVCNLSIDTRSDALDLIGVRSVPYTLLKKPPVSLDFQSLSPKAFPSSQPFIDLFQSQVIPVL